MTTLGATVAAGTKVTIDLDVMTPDVDVETPIMQALVLDDAGTTFGTIDLALTVAPGAQPDTSSDGSETPDESGGCNAGGGNAGWLGLVLGAAVLGRGRRNRRRRGRRGHGRTAPHPADTTIPRAPTPRS